MNNKLTYSYNPASDVFEGSFRAMASPCLVLLDSNDQELIQVITQAVQTEALRIEQKFSRYRDDNLIFQINHSEGNPIKVDEEFISLLQFADTCYQISDGLFDITSGVLRRVWKFRELQEAPDKKTIDELLGLIGWNKVSWNPPFFTLPANMEIDLGGIGKEYAVDRCWAIAKQLTSTPFMINFGGDLRVSGPRKGDKPWITAIETPNGDNPNEFIHIKEGALTTSGDTKQFVELAGVRYGHILNPKTGWPVANPPRSVTVAAASCVEAGISSTLAMLQGPKAEAFLDEQGIESWVSW